MKILERKTMIVVSIVFVIVITIGVIGWLFVSKTLVVRETTEIKTLLNPSISSADSTAGQKKIKDTIINLLKTDEDNQKCTFTTTIPNNYDNNKLYTYTGNVYFSENIVRIDHDNPIPGLDNYDFSSHLIFDGKYSYLWSRTLQIKTDILKYFPLVTRKENFEKIVDPIDIDRVYDFNCEQFSDKNIFIPPSGINFIELDKNYYTSPSPVASDLRTIEGQESLAPEMSLAEYSDASYQALSIADSKQVVTGYLWHSYEGSPNFSSVNLPNWGVYAGKDDTKTEYNIDIWDGNQFVFYTKAIPGKEVIFPQGGVYKFRVTGIDPGFKICSEDRGYLWGMKFVSDGNFNGVRVPLVYREDIGRICVSNNVR